MENVGRVGLTPGDMYAGKVLEGLVVRMGGPLAGGGIRIEVAEFDIEDGCLAAWLSGCLPVCLSGCVSA